MKPNPRKSHVARSRATMQSARGPYWLKCARTCCKVKFGRSPLTNNFLLSGISSIFGDAKDTLKDGSMLAQDKLADAISHGGSISTVLSERYIHIRNMSWLLVKSYFP